MRRIIDLRQMYCALYAFFHAFLSHMRIKWCTLPCFPLLSGDKRCKEQSDQLHVESVEFWLQLIWPPKSLRMPCHAMTLTLTWHDMLRTPEDAHPFTLLKFTVPCARSPLATDLHISWAILLCRRPSPPKLPLTITPNNLHDPCLEEAPHLLHPFHPSSFPLIHPSSSCTNMYPSPPPFSGAEPFVMFEKLLLFVLLGIFGRLQCAPSALTSTFLFVVSRFSFTCSNISTCAPLMCVYDYLLVSPLPLSPQLALLHSVLIACLAYATTL